MCTCTKPSSSAPQESHQLHLQAGNEHGPGYVQPVCLPAETILCCLQSTTAMSFQCWLWCSKQKCHFCFALSSCCALGCSKLFSAHCYQAGMLWIWKNTSGVAVLEKPSQPCSSWINCVPCCTFAQPQSVPEPMSFQLCLSSTNALTAAAWELRMYQQCSLSGDACWFSWWDELVAWLNTDGTATWEAALKKWVGPRHLPACYCVVLSSLVSVFWTPFASCSSACLAGDAGQLSVGGTQK